VKVDAIKMRLTGDEDYYVKELEDGSVALVGTSYYGEIEYEATSLQRLLSSEDRREDAVSQYLLGKEAEKRNGVKCR
jgi:hypothetical protein